MKFYTLDETEDPDIIGGDGYREDTMSNNYNFDTPDSIDNIPRNQFPDFIPNLNYVKLKKGLNLLDYLGEITSGNCLLINDKLKRLFKELNLLPHRYYPATVKQKVGVLKKKTYQDYSLVIFVSDLSSEKFIDFENSRFGIMKFMEGLQQEIKITSLNDLLQKDDNLEDRVLTAINPINLKLKPAFFEKKYDLFYFPDVSGEIFVSERFKQAIDKNKITGFKLEQTDLIC